MKKSTIIFILLCVSVGLLFVLPLIGQRMFAIHDYFQRGKKLSSSSFVLFQIRIPQTFMSYVIGFILAIVGVIYQTIFHNDLAGPYILGVSSGSAFGASLSIALSLTIGYINGTFVFAFIFGMLVTVILVFVYYKMQYYSLTKLILLGVALNFFFSSNILLLYYFSDLSSSFEIYHWLMGSINIMGYKKLLLFVLFSLPVLVFFMSKTKTLNTLLLQKDLAVSKGVNVNKIVFFFIIFSSILVSWSVAFVGPISFIGLMSPHIAKLIVGKNHQYSLLLSGLIGGLLLSVCFAFSRIILYPIILPVGIITGFLGSLFFIFLLFQKKIIKKT